MEFSHYVVKLWMWEKQQMTKSKTMKKSWTCLKSWVWFKTKQLLCQTCAKDQLWSWQIKTRMDLTSKDSLSISYTCNSPLYSTRLALSRNSLHQSSKHSKRQMPRSQSVSKLCPNLTIGKGIKWMLGRNGGWSSTKGWVHLHQLKLKSSLVTCANTKLNSSTPDLIMMKPLYSHLIERRQINVKLGWQILIKIIHLLTHREDSSIMQNLLTKNWFCSVIKLIFEQFLHL